MKRGGSPFIFSHAVYRDVSQLTERLEESKTDSISLHFLWYYLGTNKTKQNM